MTNLGCVLDVGLVMSGHEARMCKSAYHHLGCIRKIRNCIPMEACKLLMHSLVTSRLDYSNVLLRHVVRLCSVVDIVLISGDVVCCSVVCGTLVDALVFSNMCSELLIMSKNS